MANSGGRPPKTNPADARTETGQGQNTTTPSAVVGRRQGPNLTWTSGYPARLIPRLTPTIKSEMDVDDTVAECWGIFKGMSLDHEPLVIDSVKANRFRRVRDEKFKADYEKCRFLSEFFEYVLDSVRGGMWQYDYQLLDAAKHGAIVAVIVGKTEESGEYAGLWTLDYLQILQPSEWVPFEDEAGHLVGFQVFDQKTQSGEPIVWGLDKFVVATFRPEWGGVWGSDLYAAAYLMWVLKNKGWEQYYAAIEQIGTPTVIHKTPPEITGKVTLTDEEGAPLYWMDETQTWGNWGVLDLGHGEVKVSPQIAQHYNIRNGVKSGGTVGVAGGAEVNYLQAQDSQTIPGFVQAGTIGIHCAMLGTDKFALRGTHESSGSSEAGERIASFPASEGKAMLEMCKAQLVYSFTLWNFGVGMLPFRPRVDHGSGLTGQVPQWLNSLASLGSTGTATPFQLQSTMVNRCGFPQATAEELEKLQPVVAPNTGARPDDSPGSGSKAAS